MVLNQRPGVTWCRSICQYITELITEGFSIDIILKDISTLDSPVYDMMQASRAVYAGLAGEGYLPRQRYKVRILPMQKREDHHFMTAPFSSIETFGRRTTFKIH